MHDELPPHPTTHDARTQSRVADDDDEGGDGANYQIDMMKCLREVNVDNNTVGWCARAVVWGGCVHESG